MCTDIVLFIYIHVHLYRQECHCQGLIFHTVVFILFKGSEQNFKISNWLVRLAKSTIRDTTRGSICSKIDNNKAAINTGFFCLLVESFSFSRIDLYFILIFFEAPFLLQWHSRIYWIRNFYGILLPICIIFKIMKISSFHSFQSHWVHSEGTCGWTEYSCISLAV